MNKVDLIVPDIVSPVRAYSNIIRDSSQPILLKHGLHKPQDKMITEYNNNTKSII